MGQRSELWEALCLELDQWSDASANGRGVGRFASFIPNSHLEMFVRLTTTSYRMIVATSDASLILSKARWNLASDTNTNP